MISREKLIKSLGNSKFKSIQLPNNCNYVQKSYLKHQIYNISSFNPTVKEFYEKLLIYFNDFKITHDVDIERQKMVDSWPSEVDCSKALYDWVW